MCATRQASRTMRGPYWHNALGDELRIGRYIVRLKRSLGEGGFAFIHLVEDVTNGRELVLKRSSLMNEESRTVYEKEASIMRTLAHPNIVQVLTALELTAVNAGAIIMEYCPGGHLLDTLNKRGGKRLDEEEVLAVMVDVTSAVKYLHDKGITHRDIKLENILRSAAGLFKLCDFGSCVQGRIPIETAEQRANEEEVVGKTTTQMYRAPEMVDLYMERELTEKVDVWALGCVLYAMCYLKHPFQDAGNLGILNARIRVPSDSSFSEGLSELTKRMFCPSAGYRPSADEVENCIHALCTGHPLPPARHPPPPENGYPHGAGSGEAGGNSVGPAGVNGRQGRDGSGGRVGDSSRRNHSNGGAGAKGSRSMQGSTPLKHTAKPAREAHLNPNSVAARRLACRKGEKGAVEARGSFGSEPQHGPLRPSTGNDNRSITPRNRSAEQGEFDRFVAAGSERVQAPGGWHGPLPAAIEAPQQITAGLLSGTGAGTPRLSNFADFDQFTDTGTNALPPVEDGFGAAAFGAFAGAEDPFAVEPSTVASSTLGQTVQRGGEANPGQGTSVDKSVPVLLDLAQSEDAEVTQGDKLVPIFLVPGPASSQPTTPSFSSGINVNQAQFSLSGSVWGQQSQGVHREGLSRRGQGNMVISTGSSFPYSQDSPRPREKLNAAFGRPRRSPEHQRSLSSPSPISANGGGLPWLSAQGNIPMQGHHSAGMPATPVTGQQGFGVCFSRPTTTDFGWQPVGPQCRTPTNPSQANPPALRKSLSPCRLKTPPMARCSLPGQALAPGNTLSLQQPHPGTPHQHQQQSMAQGPLQPGRVSMSANGTDSWPFNASN